MSYQWRVASALDQLFTFATPALALFEPQAGPAFSGGLRLLKESWPRCAGYVFVPPFALQLVGRTFTGTLGGPASFVLTVVGPPLTLIFSGATVLFILRRYEPLSEGEGSLMW